MEDNISEFIIYECKMHRLWSEKGKDTPEMRKLMAELNERQSRKSNKTNEPEKKKERPLFSKSGKPLNINDSNLKFDFTEDTIKNCQILKIFLPKSLDTSDMEVDVQPWYIKVHNKRGLLFQMTLMEEVCPDKSTAERSMATGNLVITAPFVITMP
jgi:protein TilB